MKVSVQAQVNYSYEVEVPDDNDDIASFCDSADPVYSRIVKAMMFEGLNYEGKLISIVDAESDKILWDEG